MSESSWTATAGGKPGWTSGGLLGEAEIPFFVLGPIATLVQDVDPFLHKCVRVQVPRHREAEARELLEGMLQEDGAGDPGESA